jgi:hypothetical protein
MVAAAGLAAQAAALAAGRCRHGWAVRRSGRRYHGVRAGRWQAIGRRGLAPQRFGNDRGRHRGQPAVAFDNPQDACTQAAGQVVVTEPEPNLDGLTHPVPDALVRLAIANLNWEPVPNAKLIKPVSGTYRLLGPPTLFLTRRAARVSANGPTALHP